MVVEGSPNKGVEPNARGWAAAMSEELRIEERKAGRGERI
jgi:hypothetical protein